jgi:nucleotide-binding universal stress UspA family protein
MTNDKGRDYSEWQTKLNDCKEKLNTWVCEKPDVTDSIAVIGSIENTVLRISQSNDVDLIVMGTEGNFPKSMWSKASHTEYITNHSDIPVLSLKCNRVNINLKEIVLVSDFLEAEKINLSILKDIQAAYQSLLILLRINIPTQIRSEKQVFDDMQLFAKNNGLSNYVMKIYNDKSVESGISNFIAENNIDMISLGSHQGHEFSKLFRGSISDDVVNHLYRPVLTFPI